MMSLDQAVAAARLPIRMEYDLYDRGRLGAWSITHPWRPTWPYSWEERFTDDYGAKRYYVALRTRLSEQQGEK